MLALQQPRAIEVQLSATEEWALAIHFLLVYQRAWPCSRCLAWRNTAVPPMVWCPVSQIPDQARSIHACFG